MMHHSDEIIDYVKVHWNDLQAEKALTPDFFANDYERIAWHCNRMFYKGRRRFSAADAQCIVERFCNKKTE